MNALSVLQDFANSTYCSLISVAHQAVLSLLSVSRAAKAALFLCTENPQLGWGFRKAFSFKPVIKTPFDLLKHLAVWQLQV
ncbi:hypothetical protein ACP80U_22570, partial [Escherichia coli]